ncbi:MAG: DNA-processing protein DprA [Campylobacterota bacterium]
MNTVPGVIAELESMKRYPRTLYYRGSLELLETPKISIVGSRRAGQYARSAVFELSRKLSQSGMTIISGAATGIDRVAHEGAGVNRTVAVLPCGIDRHYPSSNRDLIESIATQGLVLSHFEPGFEAREWSFVARNEIVVALGSALVIAEAEPDSGSMRSAEYALAMGKPIYVLPHRLGESGGTRRLLAQNKATAIEDIDRFVESLSRVSRQRIEDTPFIAYCRNGPTYEEAVTVYPAEIFEAELGGMIEVRNGRVYPV